MLFDKYGAYSKITIEIIAPDITANIVEIAIIFPVTSGSLSLNSAMYFVAVSPSPNPAKTENIVTVERIIPSSPYSVFPMIRATIIEAININPRDRTAPRIDQKLPLINRLAINESSSFLYISLCLICRTKAEIILFSDNFLKLG